MMIRGSAARLRFSRPPVTKKTLVFLFCRLEFNVVIPIHPIYLSKYERGDYLDTTIFTTSNQSQIVIIKLLNLITSLSSRWSQPGQ